MKPAILITVVISMGRNADHLTIAVTITTGGRSLNTFENNDVLDLVQNASDIGA